MTQLLIGDVLLGDCGGELDGYPQETRVEGVGVDWVVVRSTCNPEKIYLATGAKVHAALARWCVRFGAVFEDCDSPRVTPAVLS